MKHLGSYGYVKSVKNGSVYILMKLCPKCNTNTKESERIEKDLNKNKYWLITYCARCGFNFDLTIYDGEINSPQQELDKYPWPPHIQKKWYEY